MAGLCCHVPKLPTTNFHVSLLLVTVERRPTIHFAYDRLCFRFLVKIVYLYLSSVTKPYYREEGLLLLKFHTSLGSSNLQRGKEEAEKGWCTVNAYTTSTPQYPETNENLKKNHTLCVQASTRG